MTIVYVSDFDLRGSGYMNIATRLCDGMAARGFDVIALGLGYKGQEHHYNFRLVPAEMTEIGGMVRQLQASGVKVDVVVVALDIPLQERMMDQLQVPGGVPYVGLFPIEAGPLCMSWAISLMKMDVRLVMSRFGLAEMEAQGVDGTFIPIGVAMDEWRPAAAEERELLRQGLGLQAEDFVVLTVADNQERKNLARTMEIFADFADSLDRPARHWMVTRPRSIVGWKLEDYAMTLGTYDRLALWERGVPFRSLWSLFVAADCFLLTSKAEGLGMPVLEAMACGLPVVGTRCCAIEEHLQDGRGFLIEPDYIMVDPWGNSRRYMAGRAHGQDQLHRVESLVKEDLDEIRAAAKNYVVDRTWDASVDVLVWAVGEALERHRPADGPPTPQEVTIEQEAQITAPAPA